jgi:hydrogenase nickel incorporation protein HypB
MCGTCGCDASSTTAGRDHVHHHDHDRERSARRIAVERSLLEANDRDASALEQRLAAQGITSIAIVGAPGSGKTALLEATFAALGAGARHHAVIEGDCATENDARRIARCGVRSTQINTGSLCHLDAHLVGHGLETLDLSGVTHVWIENLGNLVCPAAFRCGERHRVGLLSVAEGDDKPEKYPALFAGLDLLLVTKLDLLPHVDFDVARCIASARSIRAQLPVLSLSARTGDGMPAWLAWLDAVRA